MNIKQKKTELRKLILKQRSELSNTDRINFNKKITNTIKKLPEYEQARKILYYVDFRGEVSTKELIDTALKGDTIVCVPITIPKTRSILAYQIQSVSDLVEGNYGILEPNKESCTIVDLSEIDLVITPGVAFDNSCNRLGYGGGYYDRLVAKLPTQCSRIALAYENQIVETIPIGKYDVPVDFIITEKRIIGRNKTNEQFKTGGNTRSNN